MENRNWVPSPSSCLSRNISFFDCVRFIFLRWEYIVSNLVAICRSMWDHKGLIFFRYRISVMCSVVFIMFNSFLDILLCLVHMLLMNLFGFGVVSASVFICVPR